MKKTSMSNPDRRLGYIQCYSLRAWVAPDLLKDLAILSDKTEDLQLIQKTGNHTDKEKATFL